MSPDLDLLDHHNARRASRGLPRLALDAALCRCATSHAAWMSRTGRLSHTGEAGSGLGDRLRGVNAEYASAGENIALGQRTAGEVVAAWMASPGHRDNVLNPKFRSVGFGSFGSGRTYWCAVFTDSTPPIRTLDLPDPLTPEDAAMARELDRDEPIYTIPPDLVIGEVADALPLAGEVNYGMALFGVDRLRGITDGAGVKVGGIDTGIDKTHPLLQHCKGAEDFTGSPYGAQDRHGHGTHISGTISASDPRIGVAGGADYYFGKGLGDSGSGSGQAITAAMRWCVSQGCEVLSMSLGSPGEDPEITGLMRELAQQGVWVVAAAGNSGPNTPDVDWPGRSPHCISVAAVDANLEPASFSSAGAKIDTSGPGVQIWSCRPGGGFQQMSGTSMATPFIAGVLTLYRAALKKRNLPVPKIDALRALLFSDSTDIGPVGDDRRTGPGWLSPLLLTLNLTPDPAPVRA